jgi:hypothetical protein
MGGLREGDFGGRESLIKSDLKMIAGTFLAKVRGFARLGLVH